MKNILLAIITALIFINAPAQITVEANYPHGAAFWGGFLRPIQLTAGGDKYFEYYGSQNQIIVYNLTHSVFRTINVPTLPMGSSVTMVCYVSDALFDQNTTDLEYVIQYTLPNSGLSRVAIYRENGALLFQRDSVDIEPAYYSEVPQRIFNTTAGTKMILSNQYGDATVYALPGSLPCKECSAIPLMVQSNINESSSVLPFPNPANEFTTVSYNLPPGERTGWLVMYDVAGKEVKRMQITNSFTSVILSTQDVAAGTYSYRIEVGPIILPGEQLIIVH